MSHPLLQSSLKSLRLINQGKVRDIYDIDADKMLIITTDRLSAFDVILPTPISGKGTVLTQISNFWFDKLSAILPNHLTGIAPESIVADVSEHNQLGKRAIVVKKLKPMPIEAVVRGYLVGSGWKEYQKSGTVCGIKLPTGLKEASKLPAPIYTPSTKAEIGTHDENITFEQTVALVGLDLAAQVREKALALYQAAADYALTRGIIIADTKFEFGLDNKGQLYLIDEALTPDSSRFWPQDEYREGSSPPSFDKQFVRDWLETSGWNKQAPAPDLPVDIAERTSQKYHEAFQRLTGSTLE